MKAVKIIDKADEYLKAENRKLKHKLKYLKHVLKKLRHREKKLEARFLAENVNKEKISNELALIHAYRKKGVEQLVQLKSELRLYRADKKNSGKNTSETVEASEES